MNNFKTKYFRFTLVVLFFLGLTTNGFSQERKTINFDNDWQFTKGEITNAETPSFDDTKWTKLNVPHDWSIEGPYCKGYLFR